MDIAVKSIVDTTSHSIDLLLCVGATDVHRLMPYSLKSCIRHFPQLNQIYIVTNAKAEVIAELDRHHLRTFNGPIKVLDDMEVCGSYTNNWPGWYRQQVLRLHADQICSTPIIACLSADTIVFRCLVETDLFVEAQPILYFNRYPFRSNHLDYERQRVYHVARVLQVEPTKSLSLADFVMDFKLLESAYLRQLRKYLISLYGAEPFTQLLPGPCRTPEERVRFGEWTLYSVFLLDVLGITPPIRCSNNRIIAQIHSRREFEQFHFDAQVVHFVDKTLSISSIYTILERYNLM